MSRLVSATSSSLRLLMSCSTMGTSLLCLGMEPLSFGVTQRSCRGLCVRLTVDDSGTTLTSFSVYRSSRQPLLRDFGTPMVASIRKPLDRCEYTCTIRTYFSLIESQMPCRISTVLRPPFTRGRITQNFRIPRSMHKVTVLTSMCPREVPLFGLESLEGTCDYLGRGQDHDEGGRSRFGGRHATPAIQIPSSQRQKYFRIGVRLSVELADVV